MARSLDSQSIWQTPPQPVPAWACKEPGQEVLSRSKSPIAPTHTRSSNLINRASAVVQKRTPPSTLLRSSSHSTTSTFATLSEEEPIEKCENTNSEEPHDSLEDGNRKCDISGDHNSSPKPPQAIDLMANVTLISTPKARGFDASSNRNSNSKPSSEFEDDDEEEIGDISSSSEIEIDADPMAEVTTPQIEEMQAKMNSVFSRAAKQCPKNHSTQDSVITDNYQSTPEEEEDDEDEGDKTLRESFSYNSKTGKSISIVAAVNKAKNVERKSKYTHDENDTDLQQNNSKNISPNKINDEDIHRYSTDMSDDPDDGFAASNNGEDEGETDADDEIEDEGVKGSNRTPDSLLSPISDDMPPAKGWV